MRRLLLVAILLGMLAIAACGAEPAPTPTTFESPLGLPTATPASPPSLPTATSGTFESPLSLPNPASKHCVDQGYQSEIRTAADGSQTGYCLFPDGSECEEWAFYRGECGPSTPTP